MTATATVAATNDAYVNGLLGGRKWAVDSLTFSFPTSSSFYGTTYAGGEHKNGFEAFTAAQQSAVKSILSMYSSVTNMKFVQVTESSSVHGELRYAESDAPGTAWAYYPSTSGVGGDAWFNNSKGMYDNPAKGNYAWLTMIHETGHALGLKHPHEASGAFGAMPSSRDSLEYTVMSYRSYVGASTTTGYTNGSTSFPQTLMMYDIAALQTMYGANYSTNAGATTYKWDPATGQMFINGVGQGAPAGNKIFMTVWDGGGTDTYDFSNYAGAVKVDLNPGGWTTTSATQLATLGSGKVAVGNIANALLNNNNPASLIENAIGGSGSDTLTGNIANNTFTGGKGNDAIDGGAGSDTAVFSGRSIDYTRVKNADGSWTVTDKRAGADGVDVLKNIEYAKFSDTTVNLGGTVPTTTTPTPTEPTSTTNSAPVAKADSYSVVRGSKLVVSAASGVLKNDTDANGDSLAAVLVKAPSTGSLVLKADGSFTYTPPSYFTGTVSFTYKTTDGEATSAATTVSIKVGSSWSYYGGTTSNTPGQRAFDEDHSHSDDEDEHSHSIEEDQIPAPARDRPLEWPAELLSMLKTGKFAAPSRPVAPVVLDDVLGHLFAEFHGNGQGHFQAPRGHEFANDMGDPAGVPDFMASAYSEFVLS
jgi:hypothetical protein